jgi:hypothetical protein
MGFSPARTAVAACVTGWLLAACTGTTASDARPPSTPSTSAVARLILTPPRYSAPAVPTTAGAADHRPRLRPGERLLPLADIDQLAAVGDAVYAVTADGQLVRIHRGRVTARAEVARRASIVADDQALWTALEPRRGGATELDLRSSVSLVVERRVTLPGQHLSIAISQAGIWVGTPNRLRLVDAQTGRILRTVGLARGDGTSLAAQGRFLYVAQSNVGPCTATRPACKALVLSERDARTGVLLAQRSDLPSVVGGWPDAVAGGVWLGYSTGMEARDQLLRASDLRVVRAFAPVDDAAGTNSSLGDVSGGRLWVNDGMAERISCADPRTGRLLGTRDLAATSVVSDGRTLYAATAFGLAELKPPRRCASP